MDAGRAFTDPSRTPPSLTISSRYGFDGQFYYRLADAPFSTATYVLGVRFDIPPLRAQRVLYPLLAWLGSFGGRVGALPWALLLVNIAAMAAIGWLSGALAQASERHALWGLLIAGYPGFVYSLSFDLTEIVATAGVLAGLLALRKARYSTASVALALAVLSRESAVIVPVGILLAWAWNRIRGRQLGQTNDAGAALSALVGLAAFLAWQGYLWHVWGSIPASVSTGENARVPLEGLIRSLSSFTPTSGKALFRIAGLALMAALGVLGIWRWRSSQAPLGERVAFLLALALVLIQSEHSWPDATNFLRVGTEYWTLGVLTVLGAEDSGALGLLPPATAAIWLVAALGRIAAVGRVP